MRQLLILLLSICSASVYSLEIPSSVSGDYYGGGYVVRVLAQTVQRAGQNGIELKTIRPNSEQTSGLTIGPQACPNDWYLVPLAQWGGGDQQSVEKIQTVSYLTPYGSPVASFGFNILDKFPATWARIVAYDSQSLTLRVGAFSDLVSGQGTLVPMVKVQSVLLTSPYSGCSVTTLSRPRVRVFGL